MASSVAATNTAFSTLSSAYVDSQEKVEDPLGRDAFLTMLMAQMKNQDPLNPLDGTDFTAQLAQFTSLEQQFDINDNLEAIKATLESQSEPDLLQYIGKEISGTINSMDVYDGVASGSGSFTLSEPTGVMVAIYNEKGEEVKRMNMGQLAPGKHSVSWNGKDNDNQSVDDGTYTYQVIALNDKGGYSHELQTTVAGEVDGVVYKGGKGYLMVEDQMIDPSYVVQVSKMEAEEEK